jgi:hydrogenase 3 maturation protease
MIYMRIAVCGIGNRMRGDDGVGPEVVEALKREVRDRDILLIDSDTSPENMLGELQEFSPDKVIIVDAVELGKDPGSIGIVDIHSVKKQAMSTHKLPLSIFIDYLQTRMKFKLVFVGIQPREIGLNAEMSEECRNAIPLAKELVKQNL